MLVINHPYKGAGVPRPVPGHAPRLTEHTATGGYMFIDQTHMWAKKIKKKKNSAWEWAPFQLQADRLSSSAFGGTRGSTVGVTDACSLSAGPLLGHIRGRQT